MFVQQPFRLQPNMPPAAYKTYQILAPTKTHWRPATCAEAACAAHEQGWRTVVDESTELGQRQAGYIRRSSGRAFRESRDEQGLTVFEFPAGQRCFRADGHQVPLERDPLWRVLGGDWRGNPMRIPVRVHSSAEAWRDDFGEHQDRIAAQIEKG
jgi:hypothetical protein